MAKKHSTSKIMAILKKSNGCCWYCGIQLDKSNYTSDHVVSKKNGGTDSIDNLVPCCKRCNSRKGTRAIEQFREKLQLELSKKDYTYVIFLEEQLMYLKSIGFDITKIKPKKYLFYFETMNQEGE